MKKIIIIVLILLIPIFVKADLTKEQQEDIALFASKMITEGYKKEHKDSNGFSVLCYNQGSRDEGFYGQLSYMTKDYKSVNMINAKKWTFDCASFAAYVYYHCFGVQTVSSSNHPWVVSSFVNNASKGNGYFYFVMSNVNTSTADYSKLKKGDLIVFVGSHIMVYIGDEKIAHFSSSAISKGTNLGAEVVKIKDRYPNTKMSVIRLKDGVVSTTAKANMKITWPDTGKTQDFREDEKDDKPKVSLSLDVKDNKATIKISASDDKGLTGYYISNKRSTPNSWHSIGNKKSYSTTYEAKNNGTYYCYVKDSKNQITSTSISVSGLDNNKPIISTVVYKYIKDTDKFNLEVKATDNNGKITYALDNNNYQDSNIFNNVDKGSHKIYVKDNAGNITEFEFNLSSDLIPTINLNYDKGYTRTVTVKINGVDTVGINGYNVTRSKEEPKQFIAYKDNATYNITQNGDYYFWIRNTRGTVNYQMITISNIDSIPPTISNVEITRSKSLFNVVITATDEGCGIGEYSLDGKTYQPENTFSDVETIYSKTFVKDKCGNIATYDIDLNNLPPEETSSSSIILMILIVGVIIVLAYIYFKPVKKKR